MSLVSFVKTTSTAVAPAIIIIYFHIPNQNDFWSSFWMPKRLSRTTIAYFIWICRIERMEVVNKNPEKMLARNINKTNFIFNMNMFLTLNWHIHFNSDKSFFYQFGMSTKWWITIKKKSTDRLLWNSYDIYTPVCVYIYIYKILNIFNSKF